MNKENRISIELHHTPGAEDTRIRIQDMKSYEYEEYMLGIDEVEEHVGKLRQMYPNHQLLEFLV